jgi:hypothetical protein
MEEFKNAMLILMTYSGWSTMVSTILYTVTPEFRLCVVNHAVVFIICLSVYAVLEVRGE